MTAGTAWQVDSLGRGAYLFRWHQGFYLGLWQWAQREPKKNNPPGKVPVLGNDEKSAEPITPSAPQELTVSQSGEAQFQTLSEALTQATPQTTIRVLDDATYRENLEINGARFAGLQLIAEKGARLAPADPDKQSQHLVQITQVNDVLLKGWKIDAPKHGHAIYLFQAGNITLDELLIEQPPDVGAFGAIQIHAMRSSPDGFLEIKNCHVKTTGEAHCVLIYATSEPPSEIRLIGNRLERRFGDGTNVVVHLALSGNATLAKLVLGQNLFIGGGRALDLQLSGRLPAQSVDVVNNTFFQSKNWLAFDTMQANEPIARFANNLIIGGERISSLQLEEASRTWKFHTNWWERGPSTDLDPGRGGMIAESKAEGSLRFLSRDPNHKDFMHPAPDADWLESGLGGEEPKFLGAFGPAPVAPP